MLGLLLTTLALFCLGLLTAAVAPGNSAATAIGMLLFFPMMFFAGLWVPRQEMPSILRHIGDYTPLGAGVGVMQKAMTGGWPAATPFVVLAAYAVICSVIAVRTFRWQ